MDKKDDQAFSSDAFYWEQVLVTTQIITPLTTAATTCNTPENNLKAVASLPREVIKDRRNEVIVVGKFKYIANPKSISSSPLTVSQLINLVLQGQINSTSLLARYRI